MKYFFNTIYCLQGYFRYVLFSPYFFYLKMVSPLLEFTQTKLYFKERLSETLEFTQLTMRVKEAKMKWEANISLYTVFLFTIAIILSFSIYILYSVPWCSWIIVCLHVSIPRFKYYYYLNPLKNEKNHKIFSKVTPCLTVRLRLHEEYSS